jgi:SAM-dependent methyltransferase
MTNKIKSTFANTDSRYWDERYGVQTYAYGQTPNEYLQQHWHKAPMGRALCLADGEARNGVFLAQQGFAVTCIDFSKEGKRKALALAKSQGVEIEYELLDLNEYNLKRDSWELIVSVFFQPIEPTRQRLYGQLFDALTPKGVFILECKSELTNAKRYPGVDQLTQEITPLELCHSSQMERQLNEGIYHQGEQITSQICALRP